MKSRDVIDISQYIINSLEERERTKLQQIRTMLLEVVAYIDAETRPTREEIAASGQTVLTALAESLMALTPEQR